jgi:hypothetical protein
MIGMAKTAIDIEALCIQKGLRITEQRRVIARALSESTDHPDVNALHARASAIDRAISIERFIEPCACLKRLASSNVMISAMAKHDTSLPQMLTMIT